ncbi:TetR family transcriptional regulator [Streptomyces buecherae]|uniref:TetR family transcriptional regulator n=1 Tax=Streptomyces buecherae TaxID=2763006 RepID=UPI001C2587EC|nr:TetR family transcriptional regulator [Streptomyces buecherae]
MIETTAVPPEPMGLRERKKLRTRRALIEAAVRLVAERGYEETTVAQIAASADVSTRTFFSYFPGKDDVLFADSQQRVDALVRAVADRRPQETVAHLLLRALEGSVVSPDAAADLTGEVPSLRVRLILSSPALQARALHWLFEAQRQLTAALLEAYGDELTEPEAAAAVGALVGALVNTALICLARDASADELRLALSRAARVAIAGLASVGPKPGATGTGTPDADAPAREELGDT